MSEKRNGDPSLWPLQGADSAAFGVSSHQLPEQLLRCHGFAMTQKAVVDLDLGSAVKFVFGLTTELGLYTKPTCHTTQSAWKRSIVS